MDLSPEVLGEVGDRIKRIRDYIRVLDKLEKSLGISGGNGVTTERKHEDAPKKRRNISATVRNARILQGRYMGYVRRLTKEQREHVKKIRAVKGISAAIQMAKKLGEK